MNTVVSQLLDVDKEARMILDEAQQYYDRTIEEIDLEKKELAASYEKRAAQHLSDVRATEGAAAQARIAENDRLHLSLVQQMEDSYAQNHIRWEDELVKRCKGR